MSQQQEAVNALRMVLDVTFEIEDERAEGGLETFALKVNRLTKDDLKKMDDFAKKVDEENKDLNTASKEYSTQKNELNVLQEDLQDIEALITFDKKDVELIRQRVSLRAAIREQTKTVQKCYKEHTAFSDAREALQEKVYINQLKMRVHDNPSFFKYIKKNNIPNLLVITQITKLVEKALGN